MKRSLADKRLEFVCELISHIEWIGTECQILSATPGLPPMLQVKLLSRSALCCGYASRCRASMPWSPKFLGDCEVAAKRRSSSSCGAGPALEPPLVRPLGESSGDHPDQQELPFST